MSRHVVLLRGVNVGAHNRLPMAALRTALEDAGFSGVRTLLQSGNVVLDAELEPDAVAREVEAVIARGFGLEVDVVVRSREELEGVVARNPLAEFADDPRRHQVFFCSQAPPPEAVEALGAAELAPERVIADGRELHSWHPDGIQRSELAKRLSRARLGVTATARNWNTVTKLLAMAERDA